MSKKIAILSCLLILGCAAPTADDVKLAVGHFMLKPSAQAGPDRVEFSLAGDRARRLFELVSTAPLLPEETAIESLAAIFVFQYKKGDTERVEISARADVATFRGDQRKVDREAVLKILRAATGKREQY